MKPSCPCHDCMHRTKKAGLLYCKKDHSFPREEIKRFFGCREYESESINLFNYEKEED